MKDKVAKLNKETLEIRSMKNHNEKILKEKIKALEFEISEQSSDNQMDKNNKQTKESISSIPIRINENFVNNGKEWSDFSKT